MRAREIPAPRPALGRAALLACGLVAALACAPAAAPDAELERWRARAARVEILRDEWGVPHVYGASDADAVFGLMYAQAEDDFPRIERNYLVALGRLAEAEGEGALWSDLRARLFVDEGRLAALEAGAPAWLRELTAAWADGLNFYLATHPQTRPRALERFAPWMALAFTEGSIGGDVERIDLAALQAFYGDPAAALAQVERPAAAAHPASTPERRAEIAASGLVHPDPALEPTGSNGIAIAPARTRDGHALLLINPHTSFYFRHEAHVASGAGLNAYGALTWGQFFVYQGFNERAGWMHTSSAVDSIDEFLEPVVARPGGLFTRHGAEERPVLARAVALRHRTATGLAERSFTLYRTHHGPVVRAEPGRWVSVALMERPVEALAQSFLRTKAKGLEEYLAALAASANSSNNTIFADGDGRIAYLHAEFVPARDRRFDYDRPVDGGDPATGWRAVHPFAELPNAVDPPTGWVVNTNDWAYSAAGDAGPRREAFPAYVDRGSENPRGAHARKLLEGTGGWTLEGLRAAAFDPWLPAFESLVPLLIADLAALPARDATRVRLAAPLAELGRWDRRWATDSVATTLAVFWGEELVRRLRAAGTPARAEPVAVAARPELAALRRAAFAAALETLERDFGGWRIPWGEVNRFQRRTGDFDQPFDDTAPSTPIGFTSGRWGSLAAFGAAPRPGTKRWYGTSGNSFVAVVEFGERVRALAVTAGGVSGDPASLHFADQIERYAAGDLREVHFHRDDVEAHARRRYRPGL